MKTLTELYEGRKGTDKLTDHSYVPMYDMLMRDFPGSMLEIGVSGGGSIAVWSEWFQNRDDKQTEVVLAADNKQSAVDRVSHLPNVRSFCGNAYCNDLTNWLNEMPDLGCIVDDGPHSVSTQAWALMHLWKYLLPGGLIIIEDVRKPEALIMEMRCLGLVDQIANSMLIDLRHCKGKEDDVLFVVRKPQ